MGRFMQYYRENANYLERTCGFVERLSSERIRAVLLEDSEGIAARLDEAIQTAIDACVDTRKEADAPAVPNQFNSREGAIPATEQGMNEAVVTAAVTAKEALPA